MARRAELYGQGGKRCLLRQQRKSGYVGSVVLSRASRNLLGRMAVTVFYSQCPKHERGAIPSR